MSRKDTDVHTHTGEETESWDGGGGGGGGGEVDTLRVLVANYISCRKNAHLELKKPPVISATCHQHQLATVSKQGKCIAIMTINAITTLQCH